MTYNFSITTPEKSVFDGQVDFVELPTLDGEIGVYANHAPLVSIIKPGVVLVRIGNQDQFIAVSGGFLEVFKDRVILLADTAERAEDIDEARAEEARNRAEQIMKKEIKVENVDFAALAAKIEKEMARLKAAKKKYRDVGRQQ